MNREPHIPVMVQEILEWLVPEPGRRYLDGTLGLGGHTRAILQTTGGAAEILGIDKDEQALEQAREGLAANGYTQSMHCFQGSFAAFEEALAQLDWPEIHGALLDLGFSSWQLDDPERGFSFLQEGPLDMRLNQQGGDRTAADLVNTTSSEDLRRLLRDYGEEPMAGRIAGAIVRQREKKDIVTTTELAAIVLRAYPAKRRSQSRKHPATKTFQALRIAVNAEIRELELFLRKIPEAVRPGGRIAILSFHSLEDRMVKQWFRYHAQQCVCPPEELFCRCDHQPVLKILTKKPLTPGAEEMALNPRSRSAKLRVAEVL